MCALVLLRTVGFIGPLTLITRHKKKKSDPTSRLQHLQGKCETPCKYLVTFYCCLDVVGRSIHALQFHTLSLIEGYSKYLIWGYTSYAVLRYWKLPYEIHPDEGLGFLTFL